MRVILESPPQTLIDCISWARKLFDHYFYASIQHLLAVHPIDSETDGEKFWSKSKRAPNLTKFDSENPTHLQFVKSAAILYAQVNNIPSILNTKKFISTKFPSRRAQS
jgi:ubiquitin-activating enzyme E1